MTEWWKEIEAPIEPYFDEILPGHDCCKDYEIPKRPLSVRPYRTVLGPRDSLRLWAKGFHLHCDPGCLMWRISSGAGSLSEEFGEETVYYSPAYNEGCEGNATVDLLCGGIVISHAYIATNTFTPQDRPAYLKLFAGPRFYLFVTGKDVLDTRLEKAPKSGLEVTWLERYIGKSYLCDGTFYGEYLLMTITKRWLYDREAKKWYITEDPRTFTTEIVNDKTPFGWTYEPGKAQTVDIRSDRMKKAGCCARALLPED